MLATRRVIGKDISETADGDRSPVSVLHIGKYFPPHRGGMETFLRDLMIEQKKQGLKVAALVHSSDAGFRSSLEEANAEGQSLRVYRVARWFTLAFAPISPTFPLLLRRICGQLQPDVLHIHMPNLSPFWCLLMPGARAVPWVVHWHADVLSSRHSRALRYLYRLYRPFEQALLRRAACIVVTSPPYLESSEPLAPHKDRCVVVPLGISDSPARDPKAVGRNEQESRRDLRVLFVGRLAYYKGLPHLVEAASALDNVELRIVGQGQEERLLKAMVERLGAEDSIHFLGGLSDSEVRAELETCDCLCLPSIERTEAFGVVLLEAMRAGKAVVATRVPGSGMGWLVNDQETGILVDPGDRESLTYALKTLRDDRSLLGRFGLSGRNRLREHFVISRTAAQILDIYRILRPAWSDL